MIALEDEETEANEVLVDSHHLLLSMSQNTQETLDAIAQLYFSIN